MWEKPKTNLPDGIDLRGKSIEELSGNWVMLAGYGRKEILARVGVSHHLDLDKGMHEYLANLPGLLTNEQLQKVVDILARHGKISGLHYASRFNTAASEAPKNLIDNTPEE